MYPYHTFIFYDSPYVLKYSVMVGFKVYNVILLLYNVLYNLVCK